jgi:hypothetical protein
MSQRDINVVRELERRCDILIENAKPDEIVTGMSGSMFRFQMALAPIGYPFEPESWMDKQYLTPIIDEKTFESTLYDTTFDRLYKKARRKVIGND